MTSGGERPGTVTAVLREVPYPGRGLLVGRLPDDTLCVLYFLTGRSDASRSRELRATAGGDVEVVGLHGGPHDDLRHYTAVARRGRWLVAGNGDQVGPIADGLAAGRDAVEVWSDHTFEPDPPIYTSRIWTAWDSRRPGQVLLGAARRSPRPSGAPVRDLVIIDTAAAGEGMLLTTYAGTAERVVAASGPIPVAVDASSLIEMADRVWAVLDPALRVGLVAVDPMADDTGAVFRSR